MDLFDLATTLYVLWGVAVGVMLVCLILLADQISPHVSNDLVETEALLKRLREQQEERQMDDKKPR